MKNRASHFNGKIALVVVAGIAVVFLLTVFIWGLVMPAEAYDADFDNKFLAPCAEHIFGTDFLGRDMFFRSIKGLSNSLFIGILSALVSSVLAVILGIVSALFGGWVDKIVNLGVDMCMGLPHLVLLILISCMVGRGIMGVTIAVSLTHWPSLTRIVRSEVLLIRNTTYVQAARKMGVSPIKIATGHIVPHVIPSFTVGLILLFPHAIMHEAAITFLGFGLPKEMPALGVILAESMNYITTGSWWLAVLPGLLLMATVIFFNVIGESLRKLLNPGSGNE